MTIDKQLSILRSRAEKLAKPLEYPPEPLSNLNLTEFSVSTESYAVETKYVREIYPLKAFTTLPGTPSFVLGVMNLRGQILSILDIRELFQLSRHTLSDLNKVIVTQFNTMELGILVDTVAGIRTVNPKELEPSLPTLTGIRSEFLLGITKDRLAVLDVGKFLSSPKIVIGENP